LLQELFPGVFSDATRLFTENAVPGTKVYGERLVKENNIEFRQWDTFRSKLAAAIKNGLGEMPVKPGCNVLYLGSAEGTTISHIADIIGKNGVAFGVDVSERVMRKFILICEQRKNIVPILADADNPLAYSEHIAGRKIDVLYQDVSQKNQAEIFLKNSDYFLRRGAHGLLAIKAKSISQEKPVNEVFEKEISKLNGQFNVKQIINLKPFEKDHVMVLCEKK
jgi:fibrillarin-like pre-rRNA processing protein